MRHTTMRSAGSLRYLLLVLILLALSASGSGFGCGGETTMPELAPASALRERFADRAAQILDQGETFAATGEGFVPVASSRRGAWQRAEVALPRDGRQAIRIRGFGGREVRVMAETAGARWCCHLPREGSHEGGKAGRSLRFSSRLTAFMFK
ncbi:hypothetical protein [Sorangium sp. So ce1000]|uniref:hypothetical protein n=1 Tax=Sorangium sp. So ce1000 TaxID=3133325 RepID=UPI003F5F1ED3